MKISYPVGTKVKLVSGDVGHINAVQIFNSYHTYNVWLGSTDFLNVDEWQIESVIEQKKAGFKVSFKK